MKNRACQFKSRHSLIHLATWQPCLQRCSFHFLVSFSISTKTTSELWLTKLQYLKFNIFLEIFELFYLSSKLNSWLNLVCGNFERVHLFWGKSTNCLFFFFNFAIFDNFTLKIFQIGPLIAELWLEKDEDKKYWVFWLLSKYVVLNFQHNRHLFFIYVNFYKCFFLCFSEKNNFLFFIRNKHFNRAHKIH